MCLLEWKMYSHRKKFRQINCLVVSLVKMLLLRNFCQNRVRVNYRNSLLRIFGKNFVKVMVLFNNWFDEIFLWTILCTVVWKVQKFSLTLLSQKFRESNSFPKEITKQLIWQFFFSVRENFSFFHTVQYGKTQNFLWHKLLWKRLFSVILYLAERWFHEIFSKIWWE